MQPSAAVVYHRAVLYWNMSLLCTAIRMLKPQGEAAHRPQRGGQRRCSTFCKEANIHLMQATVFMHVDMRMMDGAMSPAWVLVSTGTQKNSPAEAGIPWTDAYLAQGSFYHEKCSTHRYPNRPECRLVGCGGLHRITNSESNIYCLPRLSWSQK